MPHLIAEEAALHFIHHYQRLLMEVVAHPSFPKPQSGEVPYLALLTQARDWMLEHPQVLQDALAALCQAHEPLPDDVQSAVTSMRAGRWVYLRDTAHYSIFLPITVHEDAQAYAVKSLTTRLRDMTGCSGLVLQTALMEYAGSVVTDGLVGTVAYLGPGYRESYGEYLAQAKAQGQFYQTQLPAVTRAPSARQASKPSRSPATKAPAVKAVKTVKAAKAVKAVKAVKNPKNIATSA